MTEAMRQLHEEHRSISRLLKILEHQLAIFSDGRRPDYDVLMGIADYFTGFLDRCHHPKENLIYEKMRARDPAAAEAVGNLLAAHDAVHDRVEHFAACIHNILNEAELSRDAIAATIRDFIDNERLHMRMEEQHFFPKAEELLSAEDWAEVDTQAAREDDPLFGTRTAKEFEKLHNSILLWEEENKANAL